MDIKDYNQGNETKRIKYIFNVNADDWPDVSDEALDTYYEFLEDNFKGDFILTGYETMGYFGWEERYIFISKDNDYEDIKKQIGSVTDHYKFIELEPHDETGVGILTHVERTSDEKKFTIPLHDLSFVDSSDPYSEILEDYTSWMTNYWYG